MADTKLVNLPAVSIPATNDQLYLVDINDTTDDASGSSRSVTVDRLLGLGLHNLCEGRLTLISGDPVAAAGKNGGTTIYFSPYNGNRISLYDGTRWRFYTFSQISLALGTLTVSLPYDVFIYDAAGTLTLVFVAWTSQTARATALVLQDGVYAQTGSLTRRYLGTFYTVTTTQTSDASTNRYLWNYYNRLSYSDYNPESTASWTSSGNGTWSAMNAGAVNWNYDFVIGVADAFMTARIYVCSQAGFVSAIARDSVSAYANSVSTIASHNNAAVAVQSAEYADAPPIGYHYLQAIQTSSDVTVVHAYGAQSPGGGAAAIQSGMFANGSR